MSVNQKSIEDLLLNIKLSPCFQPIVNQYSEIIGYEGLIRGLYKNGDLLSGQELINFADEANLLIEFDKLAIDTILGEVSLLQENEYLFINTIPISLFSKSFIEEILMKLNKIKFPHNRVVIEVLESHKIEDLCTFKSNIEFCRNFGCRIALDDVGSGYNSMELIEEIRPDIIKIDKSIIKDVHIRINMQKKLQTFLKQAEENGILVVAEGIESREEYEYLKQFRIEFFQGFLFGKPAPLKAK